MRVQARPAGGRNTEKPRLRSGRMRLNSVTWSLRGKSGYPQASENLRAAESAYRCRCVLQPSSCRGKILGNLRFTAPSTRQKYEVGKPTGAAVATGIQPALDAMRHVSSAASPSTPPRGGVATSVATTGMGTCSAKFPSTCDRSRLSRWPLLPDPTVARLASASCKAVALRSSLNLVLLQRSVSGANQPKHRRLHRRPLGW